MLLETLVEIQHRVSKIDVTGSGAGQAIGMI
jgi:hypothetical protein